MKPYWVGMRIPADDFTCYGAFGWAGAVNAAAGGKNWSIVGWIASAQI